MSTVTLNDVAKYAGVSIKTVSRVLNSEPNVSESTLERVKKAIEDLNYVPNSSARRLSSGKSFSIGFGMGWSINRPFTSAIIDNVFQESNSLGYNLSLFSLEHGQPDQIVQAYQGKQVDGFIFDTPAGKNEELRIQLDQLLAPYVIIHPSSRQTNSRASYIRINDQHGAKMAVDYLISLGHENIGYISHNTGISQEKSRLSGYQKAFADAGLPINPNLFYGIGNYGFETGLLGARKLLTTCKDITAIFAETDDIAMGVLGAAWQMGIVVPDDLSVIGFDDITFAEISTPPLTTIHQPIGEIARLAVKVLINMIDHPEAAPVDLVLSTKLVIRGSCKPPKKRAAGA